MKHGNTNIAIVVYSHYSRVSRVRKYAETLAGKNFNIDIIALNENYIPGSGKINLIKYPFKRKRISLLWYLFEYLSFFIYIFFTLTFRNLFQKYKIIQIQNMPDFLVFAAVIPKMTGTKIILDMHDPMPELFMTKYHVTRSNPVVSLLKFIEKQSFNFSDRVLTANYEFKRIFLERHKNDAAKLDVILNVPDPSIFKPARAVRVHTGEKFKMLYMGTVDERFGLDIVIRGINIIKNKIPDLEFTIIPRIEDEGIYFKDLVKYLKDNSLLDIVRILNPEPVESVVTHLRSCSLGIVPLKRSVFTELLVPVKLLEFIAMGIPVIATRTATLSKNFTAKQLLFLNDNTPEEFANLLFKIYKNPKQAGVISKNAYVYLRNHNWPSERKKYLGIISKIMSEWSII